MAHVKCPIANTGKSASQFYSDSEVIAAMNVLNDTKSFTFMNVADLISRMVRENDEIRKSKYGS